VLESETNNLNDYKFQDLTKDGGTIIFIDMPPVSQNSSFWQNVNTCKRIYTYNDGKRDIGYVYNC
jgi:hypothetical protein